MALEFLLNGTQIYPTVNSTITERIGTFSDATLPLEINNIKNPFLPMSHLQIRNTDENNWNFVVVADDVETISKDGSLFRHNLTIRSAAYENTKHILRNTRFSQPPLMEKSCELNFLLSTCAGNGNPDLSGDVYIHLPAVSTGKNYSSRDLKLNKRTKISGLKIVCYGNTYHYKDSIFTLDGYEACSQPVIENWEDNPSFYEAVKIGRYDNGILTRELTCDELTINDAIFKNITDNTVLKLYPNDSFIFRGYGNNDRGILQVTHFKLILDTYYYSMYDVANTLYKQSKKTYNSADSIDLSCMRIDNNDKIAELSSIIAPEIDFTGMTFYDAMYQLFSYIDAIPVVDSNGYLSYEYLNNYDSNKLINDMNSKRADEKINLNDEYYTNKLVANYQNGRQKNAITYPSVNKLARVNTKELGIPNPSDYIFKLPKPIDYIDNVEITFNEVEVDIQIGTYKGYGTSDYRKMSCYVKISKINITNQVVNDEIYGTLSAYSDYYHTLQQQNNTFCYSRGSDYIDLLGNATLSSLDKPIYIYAIKTAINFQFGLNYGDDKPSNLYKIDYVDDDGLDDKQELYYRVTYHGLYNGKMVQASLDNKYDGETYVNQESGQVNLNRMGNNLQGLIAKVGNEIENITLNVTSYGSRMRVGSIWKTDDGEKFVANVVQTTFSTNENNVIVNAQFTKNFNLLSQYTKIDQQKRFYEISNELTSKGYETITEYLYLSYEDEKAKGCAIKKAVLETIVGDTLLATFDRYQIDYATFRPYTYEDDVSFEIYNYIYLPLHIYGAGNSLCFEMDFDSPINAMNRLTGSGTPSDPYYSKTSLYTEKNGFADKCEIKLWHDITYRAENYPIIEAPNIDDDLIVFNDYKCFKKPNEIFHLNYALAFLTKPNNKGEEFFVGDKFVNDNAIMPNAILSKVVRFAYGTEKYSIIDNKNINANKINCTIGTIIQENDEGKFNILVRVILGTPVNGNINSWALVDENDNVLIASNKEMSNVSEVDFYVIPRRYRL